MIKPLSYTDIIHGFGMWSAWGLLGFLQLASNRYLKHHWRAAMWIHRISGCMSILITLSMGFLAFNKAGWVLGSSIHCYFGLFIMVTSALLGLGGFIARRSL